MFETISLFGFFSKFSTTPTKTQPSSMWNLLSGALSLGPILGLVVGIIFTVVGSCLMAVGSVMMKIGIQRDMQTSGWSGSAFPFCQAVWWMGFSLYTFGAILHALALAFAPASILAPMNSLGLVANAAVAATVLSEPFGFRELVGTAGTIVGVTLCAISTFLPHDESRITSGLDSWMDLWYLSYVGTCSALSIAALVLVNAEELHVNDRKWDFYFKQHVDRGHMDDIELATTRQQQGRRDHNKSKSAKKKKTHSGENINFLRENERDTKVAPPRPGVPQYPARLGMLYGFLAGLVGAQCVLELKEFCACVKLILAGDKMWTSPLPYASATLCILAIFLQIHFLNLGLSRGDATLVVPTYYVFWTVFGTLGGFSKFHECVGFGWVQIILFVVGLLVTLCCIAFMAVREIEQHVLRELEKSVPVLIGSELDDGQVVQSSLRRLQMNIPLTFGYGLLPFGSLGGRPKMGYGAHPEAVRLRRVRSHDDIPVTALSDTVGWHAVSPLVENGRQQNHDQHGAYNWTVAAASNWRMTEAQTPLVSKIDSFNYPPTVDDLLPPPSHLAQGSVERNNSTTAGGVHQNIMRVSPLLNAASRPNHQRRRGLNEIVYADEVN
eukprot:Lankesteria_metandrocarpae@DN4202_c0_g1_i1.p1